MELGVGQVSAGVCGRSSKMLPSPGILNHAVDVATRHHRRPSDRLGSISPADGCARPVRRLLRLASLKTVPPWRLRLGWCHRGCRYRPGSVVAASELYPLVPLNEARAVMVSLPLPSLKTVP